MAPARPFLVIAGPLLGLNHVLPPLPFFPGEVALGAVGLLVAALGLAAADVDRPWGAGVALALLALVALPPVVPYAERHCSDVPRPGTDESCEARGTVQRPPACTLLVGRSFGQGDLGSTSWTTPWWAATMAALWTAAALALAGRWSGLPRPLR